MKSRFGSIRMAKSAFIGMVSKKETKWAVKTAEAGMSFIQAHAARVPFCDAKSLLIFKFLVLRSRAPASAKKNHPQHQKMFGGS